MSDLEDQARFTIGDMAEQLQQLQQENERLKQNDEVHWKTRKSLLNQIASLTAKLEAAEREWRSVSDLQEVAVQMQAERIRTLESLLRDLNADPHCDIGFALRKRIRAALPAKTEVKHG